ncbi:hypothetical protein GQ53DRAFT_85792 [Thozetella sp. PMI_491]|nr:hypothetical protein GQ53DRAFT_85792 [Thozetella sp. PMI_491]
MLIFPWLWLMGLGSFHAAFASQIISGRAFDRIVTIWLENQDFAKVVNDPHWGELKKDGILQTRYYAHTHPSQPNYLAAIAGDYFGLNHDSFVRIPENVSTVVDLLDWRWISWAGYFEDLPGPGYLAEASDGKTGNGGWDYVRKHNPFVSFDSIANNGSRLLNIQSFGDFERAVKAKKVPQFVFMSPNMMNDGHNTSLEYATEWAHHFLQPLLANNAFGSRTLVQLTWDESETYSEPNHIGSLLLGNAIPKFMRGMTDDTFYTHYSILSTVQYNWELPSLGRYDVGANVFKWVAELSGFKNKEPANAASANNSVSYPGALNNGTDTFRPIPVPNTLLIGAGGIPVLNSIRLKWLTQLQQPTPYDGSGRFVDGYNQLPVYSEPKANIN